MNANLKFFKIIAMAALIVLVFTGCGKLPETENQSNITWRSIEYYPEFGIGNNYSSFEYYITDIAYGNDRFVAVGCGGLVMYSDDGIDWNIVEEPFGNRHSFQYIVYIGT